MRLLSWFLLSYDGSFAREWINTLLIIPALISVPDQTLGIKYELQCTLRHHDIVIGECPLAGFKTVKVKPAV
jgi:hypothetical protein